MALVYRTTHVMIMESSVMIMSSQVIEQPNEDYFIRRISFDAEDDDNDEKSVVIYQKWNCDESGVVWDASLLLAKYLEHQSELSNIALVNTNCLELGTGTGFLGIWLAASGANVLVTDLDSNLDLARKNIHANSSVITNGGGSIRVHAFDWCDQQCLKWMFLDWRALDSIDYILVADCLYYQKGVEAIYNFIDWLLNSPSHPSDVKAKIYVSYEDRDDKMDLILNFYSMIKRNVLLKCEVVSPSDLHPDYESDDLHLLMISKR